MGADGSVQKGFIKTADKLYYSNEDTGVIYDKGWLEVDGERYFAASDGVLYRNQVITFGNTWYCMGADGSVQKGIVEVGGRLYNTDETTGIVIKKKQWIEKDGKRYFAAEDGVIYQNQLLTFGSTWYYMGADGSVQTGIVNSKGTYYFADLESGIIRKQAGWIEYKGKKYFSQTNGVLYKNQFISFNETYYYCGSDAAIVTGQQVVDGVIYNFDSNGVMKKEGGWGEYRGNKYYKNPATGFPYKNQWVSFGSTYYYANVNGFMVSGWQTIGGYRYYFYSSTNIMARNTTIDGIKIGADGVAIPPEKEQMKEKAQGYYSSTPYLLLVNRETCKTGIFVRKGNSWEYLYYWSCAPGKPETPTVSGVFTVQERGYTFYSYGSRCYWYTQFWGDYLFHSITYNNDGTIQDDRVGLPLSHGCVRLETSQAKWIYDNIPRGTTVVIY